MRSRVLYWLVFVACIAGVLAGCAAEQPVEPAFDEGAEVEATERVLRELGVPLHDGVTVLMKVVEPDAVWTYEQELDDPYDDVVEWHQRAYAAGGWTLVAEEPVEGERWTGLELYATKDPLESVVTVRAMDDGRTTVTATVGKEAELR
jgi:hypothetical protein